MLILFYVLFLILFYPIFYLKSQFLFLPLPLLPPFHPLPFCSSESVRYPMESRRILSSLHIEARSRTSPSRLGWARFLFTGNGLQKGNHSLWITSGATASGPTNCTSHFLSPDFMGARFPGFLSGVSELLLVWFNFFCGFPLNDIDIYAHAITPSLWQEFRSPVQWLLPQLTTLSLHLCICFHWLLNEDFRRSYLFAFHTQIIHVCLSKCPLCYFACLQL